VARLSELTKPDSVLKAVTEFRLLAEPISCSNMDSTKRVITSSGWVMSCSTPSR
jgi:hypothetical protein